MRGLISIPVLLVAASLSDAFSILRHSRVDQRPIHCGVIPRDFSGEEISSVLHRVSEYQGKVVVVKYGGHAMGSKEARASFASDLSTLQAASIDCVVVHGGGPEIKNMLEKLEIPTRFEQGLRVTDSATVEVAEMVLSGTINKRTVHEISQAGGTAIGLSGKDSGLIKAKPVRPELGLVGTPVEINVTFLRSLLDQKLIPVIAPIGVGIGDDSSSTYNINADTAAGAIAEALGADRLQLLTDVPGVLTSEKQLIDELSPNQVAAMTEDGTITGGMIPKLETAVSAVKGGVGEAIILDGRQPHAVLVDLLGSKSPGTRVTS